MRRFNSRTGGVYFMAKFIRIFISERHLLLIRIGVWSLTFVLTLGLLAMLAAHQLGEAMASLSRSGLEQSARQTHAVDFALSLLKTQATAAPCTPAFRDQLRQVAYLPDGLNEFLYAPGGQVQCSVSIDRFAVPFDLGRPDIAAAKPGDLSFWIDRNLEFVRLIGLAGTVELSEPFAVVVPSQKLGADVPSWMSFETVLAAPDGRWWHRGGEAGLYERAKATQAGGWSLAGAFSLHRLSCDESGLNCIAIEAATGDVFKLNLGLAAMALVFAALLAGWLAERSNGAIRRYWSLEARFRRHLDARSIVCAYQPIMNLKTGEMTGCEVLARWRDVDDTVLLPDKFLAIVEKHDLTRHFTRMVAERAFAELSAALPPDRRLQVNFNIFPRDLDCTALRQIFATFEPARERFQLVLEIIESDALVVDEVQREIDALRRAGIKVCIDDFGTGFSNIHNLAALTVDCVKLDRAFAMAPDNSMMALMLGHAIDMVRASGRSMVVEGVETAERLAQLRDQPCPIDHVQGYFISRPLPIARFAEFIASRTAPQKAARVMEAAE